MRSRLLVVCAPLLVAGCFLLSPTRLDAVVENQVRAQCHFAFACCTPVERATFLFNDAKDEATCVEETLENGSSANVIVDRAKAVVAAGKGTFDQERADACLKPALDALNTCDAEAAFGGVSLDAVCAAEQERGFVVGNVGDGDDCDDDIECADFGVCDRFTDAEPNTITTHGSCVAAKQQGEVCVDPDTFATSVCVPGTVCLQNEAGTSYTCEEATLTANGGSCFSDSDCESGNCAEVTSGTCFFGGDPCTDDTTCADANPGDFCNVDFSSECAPPGSITVEVCDGV